MNLKRFIRYTIALIAVVGLYQGAIFAQPLNDLQKENFRKEIDKLLKTYSDMASLASIDEKFDLSKANSLRATFIETQKNIVFNDLLPQKVDGDKYLAPIIYTQFAQKYYPEGLDVTFQVQDISIEPLPVKGKYTAIVKVHKETRGFYASKRIHHFTGSLFLYIQANFIDTKVDKIGISLVADPEKHAQVQSNKNLGGLYAGLSGMYNQSLLFNPTIFTNSTWSTTMGSGISPSIEVYYMITKGFGIGTGIRLSNYSTTLNIKNFNKQLNSTVTDIDGDEYNPIFNIPQLEEMSSIKTLDIPICLKFRGGKGKTGFYFDIGAIYSTFREATYTLNGTATTKGYYQEYSVTLEDIPEYHFETTVYNSRVGNIAVPDKNLSAFVSLGLSFVVYPNISVKFGANTLFGLTDLLYNKSRHPVDFYATTGLQGEKTNLLSAGVEIGVYYRILSGM